MAGGDANGGHRLFRFLMESHFGGAGWATELDRLTSTCSLATFNALLGEVDTACCTSSDESDEDACIAGVPTSCAYHCGRVWTKFYEQCKDLLNNFFDDMSAYARFTGSCLDVDPVGMTLALADADCSICGDGDVTSLEQCDDGAANANAPGACRTNCEAPRCGDEIVDPGETCDDGFKNCGSTQSLDGCADDTICGANCQNLELPNSCQAIKAAAPGSTDGVYEVRPTGAAQPISVYCDMMRNGGGWTLLVTSLNNAWTVLNFGGPSLAFLSRTGHGEERRQPVNFG